MSTDWKPNPNVERELHEAAERGAEAAGQVFLRASKENTPVATGRLVGSARLVTDGTEASVLYDETSTIAAAVHEDMTAHHDHGSAKFLERAMNSQRAEALEAAARPLRETIGG